MAIAVAMGLHDRHLAVLVHRQKVVATGGRLDGVSGDLDVAVGTVLEADRRRQARGQFAVHLALGGARADGAPGDQVTQVLRRDHVQKLAAGRQPEPVDVDQQLARDAQALVDAEGFVQIGVVDQALPAHRGARLLKIDPHHDFQRVGIVVALGQQAARILQRRRRVMDGAGADHHQQAVVAAGHDVVDAVARIADQGLDGGAMDREEADQVFGRRQHGDVLDALVISLAGAVSRLGDGGFGLHGGLLIRSVGKTTTHKKTAGAAGGFWKIGTFGSGTFRTLYRRGRWRTKSS